MAAITYTATIEINFSELDATYTEIAEPGTTITLRSRFDDTEISFSGVPRTSFIAHLSSTEILNFLKEQQEQAVQEQYRKQKEKLRLRSMKTKKLS